MIGAFLEHLEHERHNSVRTRNVRLTGIRSFFRYAPYREPAHAQLIARVVAIPDKRIGPRHGDLSERCGARGPRGEPGLQHLARPARPRPPVITAQTGVRVAELIGLRNGDVELGPGRTFR